MEGAVKILLLAAQILLVSANYRSLDAVHRVHVDKALKEASSKFGKGHHVAFDSLIGNPNTMASSLYVNVQLIVTTCEKASENPHQHRDQCDKRKKETPLIDCLVCKTTDDQELVDCAMRIVVKNGLRNNIRNTCINYHVGQGSVMTQQQFPEDKQIGCLGCI